MPGRRDRRWPAGSPRSRPPFGHRGRRPTPPVAPPDHPTHRRKPMTLDENAVHDEVRARYAEAARAATARRSDSDAQVSCCGPDGSAVYGDHLYADADRKVLPDAALL